MKARMECSVHQCFKASNVPTLGESIVLHFKTNSLAAIASKHNYEKLTIFNHPTNMNFLTYNVHVHYVTRIAYIFGICVVQIWTGARWEG